MQRLLLALPAIALPAYALENQDTMYQAFFAGRCDALSQDSSGLAVAIGVVSGKPADFVVLPERISKEPLGPFVRAGDEVWAKIVRWTLSVMIEAEELGVTQARAAELAAAGSAAQKRLLGVGDDMGKPLGLDPKWPAAVRASSAMSARRASSRCSAASTPSGPPAA